MLSNEEAKQEAIKKAYGRAHHKNIDKNGWAKFSETKILSIPNESFEQRYVDSQLMVRPKTLLNIEDNNGWIRIEPDGSNLPEYNVSIIVLIPDEDNHITSGMWDIDNKWVLLDENRVTEREATHWMPIPKLPIY